MSVKEKIIFTRYLFIKNEVELSLLSCLLNKLDDALYWSFELYYSGFIKELITLLIKIFYDFYYILNNKFESYLFLKIKKFWQVKTTNEERILIIAQIVNNLLIRPFNCDVFMIRIFVNEFEIEDYDKTISIGDLLKTKNYLQIGKNILETENCEETLKKCVDHFKNRLDREKVYENYEKIRKLFEIDGRVIILARVMGYFASALKLKTGRDLFMEIEPEELVIYETFETDKRPYKVLSKTVLCNIDPKKWFKLFELERKDNSFEDIRDKYWYNWTYYASFSPLWKTRIEKFGGKIDTISKKVVFMDDKDDEFYNNYQFDPDEQTLKIQECLNPNIAKYEKDGGWKDFYNNVFKKSLEDGNYVYKIDEDYLENLEKIRY